MAKRQANSSTDGSHDNITVVQGCHDNTPEPPAHHSNMSDLPARRNRRRRRDDFQCPVCGLTMRDGQVKQHYEMEIVKLGEIRHKKRKEKKRLSRNEDDGTTFQTSFDKAKEVLSESRKHRLVWKCANPVLQMGLGGVVVEQVCPLCGESVDGSHSDLTAHVENCISRVSSADNEDSDDGGSELDTYEWCGETRIRVSSLLPSTALPDHVVVASSSKDQDDVIDVEGDDEVSEFGPPQYQEDDLIPCTGGEENPMISDGLHQQNSVQEFQTDDISDIMDVSRSDWSKGKSPLQNKDNGKSSVHSKDEGISPLHNKANRKSPLNTKDKGKMSRLRQSQMKCPICMDSFTTPVISVKCWHVFCEECWLRSLGAQRLCAKCKLITAPNDLRKIFI